MYRTDANRAGLSAWPDLLATAAAVLVLAATALFVWRFTAATAFFDSWDWLADYQSFHAGRYTLHDLLRPHNEHRLLTTRLLLFADAECFGMTGRFVVLLNLALLAGFGVLVHRLGRPGAAGLGVPVALVAALAASTCQWFNLILPFQVQYALAALAELGAAGLLARATQVGAARRAAVRDAVLAGLCVWLAVFTMGSGVIELPWLVALLVARRAQLAPALVFLVLAAAALAAFLTDYHPHQIGVVFSADPVTLIHIVLFAAAMLGSVFYAFGVVPILAGVIGLGLFTAAGALVLRRFLAGRVMLAGRFLALLAVAGTFVTAAFATAVSRLTLGLAAALHPRYASASLVFWLCLCPVVLDLAGPGLRRRLAAARVPLLAALGLLVAANALPRYAQDAAALDGPMVALAQSMRDNIYVPELLSAAYYADVDTIRPRIALMRARGVGPFAHRSPVPSEALRRQAATDPASLPACQGQVDFAYRLDDSHAVVRLRLAAGDGGAGPGWVALVTPGAAPQLIPATLFGAQPGFDAGVVVPAATATVTLRALGLFPDRLPCALPVAIQINPLLLEVPPLAPLAPRGRGDGAPALAGGFHPGSRIPGLEPPAYWPATALYTATQLGMARFEVSPPDEGDIVVPFAGGDGGGGALTVGFPDGGREGFVLPPLWLSWHWRLLTIPRAVIAAHGKGPLSITATAPAARDRGFLAVGAPAVAPGQGDWARYLWQGTGAAE
jgi:hypothetical protein